MRSLTAAVLDAISNYRDERTIATAGEKDTLFGSLMAVEDFLALFELWENCDYTIYAGDSDI